MDDLLFILNCKNVSEKHKKITLFTYAGLYYDKHFYFLEIKDYENAQKCKDNYEKILSLLYKND